MICLVLELFVLLCVMPFRSPMQNTLTPHPRSTDQKLHATGVTNTFSSTDRTHDIALGSWIHPIRYNHMYCEECLGAEYMPSQASCDCKPMNSWNKGTTFHEGITLCTKSLQYAKYMP